MASREGPAALRVTVPQLVDLSSVDLDLYEALQAFCAPAPDHPSCGTSSRRRVLVEGGASAGAVAKLAGVSLRSVRQPYAGASRTRPPQPACAACYAWGGMLLRAVEHALALRTEGVA